MDRETCRICDRVCQVVCEKGLSIDWLLYHNVFQNELRRLGAKGYVEYPFAPWVKEQAEHTFSHTVAVLQSLQPVRQMRTGMPAPPAGDGSIGADQGTADRAAGGDQKGGLVRESYKDADTPYSKKALASLDRRRQKGRCLMRVNVRRSTCKSTCR